MPRDNPVLVLTRKRDERIVIGTDIVITVVSVKGSHVAVGVDAPRQVPVLRSELANDENQRRRYSNAPSEIAAKR